MTVLYMLLWYIIQLFCFHFNGIKASSCSEHTDCPIDQCCGQPRYDILNIAKTCQPYAKEGESCHGSLITATCECESGLVCREHTWISGLFHTSKGVCFLCIACYSLADHCKDANSYGRTFVFGATHGRDEYYDHETDTLHIASQASGHVTIQTHNASRTYHITEGLTTIDIPKYLRHQQDGKQPKGIVIKADTDVAAYIFQNYPLYDSSGITLLPVEVLSNSYILTTYEPYSIYYKSYFVVVSFMDETYIEVTLRTINNTNTITILNDTLNKFESFYIQRHHDISGTFVTSSQPVAVFSGADCVDVPYGIPYGNCDRVDTQVIPNIYLGTDYIVPSMYPRLGYMVRILSIFSDTDVILTNRTRSLSLSFSSTGTVKDVFLGTDPVVVQSNFKIAVYQYSVSHAYDQIAGSEFMIAIPPVSQYLTEYFIPTQLKPNYYSWTYRNFASIIIDTNQADELLINGTTPDCVQNQSLPAPYNQYSVFTFELEGTSQNISHINGSVKFGLLVYGQNDATGYGFSGGRQFHVSGPINVALGKPTTQSSKLGNGIPSHAVDGNRNQTYSEGSCSHTLNSGPESWWMVDLLNIYNIDSIMIFNRIDCCSSRLDNVAIGIAVDLAKFTNAIVVNGAFGSHRTWTLTNVQARYIKVTIPGHQFLTLCEVEIYGTLAYKECPIWNYTTSEPGTLHQISVLPSSPVTITKGSTTQGIVKTSTESLTTSVYTKTSAIKPQTKSLVTTPKISQTTIRLTTKYLITKTTTSVTKTDVTKYTGDPGIIG